MVLHLNVYYTPWHSREVRDSKFRLYVKRREEQAELVMTDFNGDFPFDLVRETVSYDQFSSIPNITPNSGLEPVGEILRMYCNEEKIYIHTLKGEHDFFFIKLEEFIEKVVAGQA